MKLHFCCWFNKQQKELLKPNQFDYNLFTSWNGICTWSFICLLSILKIGKKTLEKKNFLNEKERELFVSRMKIFLDLSLGRLK